MAGDAATAGRLREVLKRAYETLESYDSSFTKLDSPIRLERLELEQVRARVHWPLLLLGVQGGAGSGCAGVD